MVILIKRAAALIVALALSAAPAVSVSANADTAGLTQNEIERLVELIQQVANVDYATRAPFQIKPGQSLAPEHAAWLLVNLVTEYQYMDTSGEIHNSPARENANPADRFKFTKQFCENILVSAIGATHEFQPSGLIKYENGAYLIEGASGGARPEAAITKITKQGEDYLININRWTPNPPPVIDPNQPPRGDIENPTATDNGGATVVAYKNPKSMFGFTIKSYEPRTESFPIDEINVDKSTLIRILRTCKVKVMGLRPKPRFFL